MCSPSPITNHYARSFLDPLCFPAHRIYVKLQKYAQGNGFGGIRQREELLVSYGKRYWRRHVWNLMDFVMSSVHERKQEDDCTLCSLFNLKNRKMEYHFNLDKYL